MPIDWRIFTRRPYIKSLSLEEQVRLFNIANEKSIRYRTRSGDGDTGVTPFTNTRSLSFDGTDDFISFSSAISLSGEFTLSAWVKPVSLSVNQGIIVSSTANNQNKIGIDSASQVEARLDGVSSTITDGGSNNFTTGTWQHILIIKDSSNIITVFRNGSAFGSPSSANNRTGTFDSIGNFRGVHFLDEQLDEIAIFNTDQTANISTIYNSGVPSDLSSLSPLHWYRFEEGSGTTATDSGTGGNNGTINGATYSTDVPT